LFDLFENIDALSVAVEFAVNYAPKGCPTDSLLEKFASCGFRFRPGTADFFFDDELPSVDALAYFFVYAKQHREREYDIEGKDRCNGDSRAIHHSRSIVAGDQCRLACLDFARAGRESI
jgi:hypothetical protein